MFSYLVRSGSVLTSCSSLFSFYCLISVWVERMLMICNASPFQFSVLCIHYVQCNSFHSTKLCIIFYLFNIVSFANMSVNNQEGLESTHGVLIEVYTNCCGNCMPLFCSRTVLSISGCTWVMCLLSAWMCFAMKSVKIFKLGEIGQQNY